MRDRLVVAGDGSDGFRLNDCRMEIFAGEAPNHVKRFPDGMYLDVNDVVVLTIQQISPPKSLDKTQIGHDIFFEMLAVRFCSFRSRLGAPDAHDHDFFSTVPSLRRQPRVPQPPPERACQRRARWRISLRLIRATSLVMYLVRREGASSKDAWHSSLAPARRMGGARCLQLVRREKVGDLDRSQSSSRRVPNHGDVRPKRNVM